MDDQNAQKHIVVNRTELLHYYRETFSAAITKEWVDPFLRRRNAKLLKTASRTQENPRLEIHRSFWIRL
jgi:hypothetical protein